ncbi:MAG: flavin reductase [Chloroflexia bacterium]|nr:flavin reductase [Chloroflexia bacterium]
MSAPDSRSGGGIVRGGSRGTSVLAGDAPVVEQMRAVRRRWASGLAVVTTVTDVGLRGITVASFMVVSLDPPLVAFCPTVDGEFGQLLSVSGLFAISILNRDQEFMADRFAARGPLPDAAFTGIPHESTPAGLPVLTGSLAWLEGEVSEVRTTGDHLLVLGSVSAARLLADSDDPLLSYEAAYRGLESA